MVCLLEFRESRSRSRLHPSVQFSPEIQQELNKCRLFIPSVDATLVERKRGSIHSTGQQRAGDDQLSRRAGAAENRKVQVREALGIHGPASRRPGLESVVRDLSWTKNVSDNL